GRAEVALEKAKLTTNSESVLVQSRDRTVDDPAFQAAIAEVARGVSRSPGVSRGSSPTSGGGQVSADHHSAPVEFQLPSDKAVAEEEVDGALAAVAAAQRRHPEMRIEEMGEASANKALERVFSDDLNKAETTSLPVTLVILVLAFGALVA